MLECFGSDLPDALEGFFGRAVVCCHGDILSTRGCHVNQGLSSACLVVVQIFSLRLSPPLLGDESAIL